MVSSRAALLLLVACSRTGVASPGAALPDAALPDAGAAPVQRVYQNDCRAISDYFLVHETPEACVIAAFGDRFPPADGETRDERADVTRGPAPCPPPGDYVDGYPEERTTLDLEVRRRGDLFEARVEGTFRGGRIVAFDFASSDRRTCCECWGARWPVRP